LRADTSEINGLQTITNHSTQHARNTKVHSPFLRATALQRFDGAPMPALTRSQKITFGEMRSSGVRCILIYCARTFTVATRLRSARTNGPITSGSPIWNGGSVRLQGLRQERGADVRPDFPVAAMGLSR